MAKTSSGKTTRKRNLEIIAWIEARKAFFVRNRTSEQIAEAASLDLGYKVSANRIARELMQRNITFQRTDADPALPVYTKAELLSRKTTATAQRGKKKKPKG